MLEDPRDPGPRLAERSRGSTPSSMVASRHYRSYPTSRRSMPDVVPDEIPWSQFDGWTVGRVRQGIRAMAAAEGDDVSADALLFAALEHDRVETIRLKAVMDEVTRDLDHMRRERLLASAPQ